MPNLQNYTLADSITKRMQYKFVCANKYMISFRVLLLTSEMFICSYYKNLLYLPYYTIKIFCKEHIYVTFFTSFIVMWWLFQQVTWYISGWWRQPTTAAMWPNSSDTISNWQNFFCPRQPSRRLARSVFTLPASYRMTSLRDRTSLADTLDAGLNVAWASWRRLLRKDGSQRSVG